MNGSNESEQAGTQMPGQVRAVPESAPHRPSVEPGSDVVARARTSFLTDEPLAAGVVRDPILASWRRSRMWQVPTDHLDLPFDPDADDENLLTRAADPVLRDVADQFAAEPVSMLLCDARGVVLRRHTGDSELERHLDRVWLAPGFSYAEKYVGTNGIGTALENRAPAQVFGHEHYVEHLEDLACAGVPIRHPVTGKILGVVDLTCWRREAAIMMAATSSTIARRIEEMLLEHSGRRELALMHDFLTACRRNRGAVVALGDDLLMMNDRARELIGPADQVPLLAQAAEALATGRRQQLVVDLPSGLTARVQCRPSFTERGVAGGVLQVQAVAQPPSTGGQLLALPHAPPHPAAVGSTALWVTCCQAVDRYFQTREWLILEGEPGTGKTTLARATHQRRTPAAHLRVLDAENAGPEWVAEVAEELELGGGTLVLTHLDRIPPESVGALVEILEPCREATNIELPWVVGTLTRPGRGGEADLAALLSCFPRTVQVPPLRHHIEDVAELVPNLLSRITRGGNLRCSPEVMRVFMRNRWPGNVEQLYQVLRKIVAKRRSGVVELRDLPSECLTGTRRVLTPLEAIECDAIVTALIDTNGNKVEAARLLGMSRATIYRKIRHYGISLPAGADSTPA